MPLTRRLLALPAEPPSVKLARAWVSEVLDEIGRADLVDAAQLGVSELVTNAILHAKPPLTVSVRGTGEHPRIEVTDHSPGPIQPPMLSAVEDEDAPATVGRGLALVAVNASQWGFEAASEGWGKRVWFEPAAKTSTDADPAVIFHPPEETAPAPAAPPVDSVPIVLLNMPAVLFGHLRRYHYELRRELRLLSLAHPERYPLAVRVTELFARGDGERRATSGVNVLDEAIARGLRSVDLSYAVPPSAPSTMARLQDLLERIYRVFADEHLLAMAPPPELRSLQRWYFGQFVSQGNSAEPIAWTGPAELASSSVG